MTLERQRDLCPGGAGRPPSLSGSASQPESRGVWAHKLRHGDVGGDAEEEEAQTQKGNNPPTRVKTPLSESPTLSWCAYARVCTHAHPPTHHRIKPLNVSTPCTSLMFPLPTKIYFVRRSPA